MSVDERNNGDIFEYHTGALVEIFQSNTPCDDDLASNLQTFTIKVTINQQGDSFTC